MEPIQFGRYLLTERLGAGGMAEVFLATYAAAAGVTKQVVVKRILPHLADDPAFVQMFVSEAKLSARLSHGNIVQLFDFGEVAGTWFLAMEYVEGRSLEALLEAARAKELTRMPPTLVAHIGIEICK